MPTPTETATTPYNGEVLIVTAESVGSELQVTAMVPGVSEADGTCTLELVDTGATAQVGGTAGNDVTYCGVMSVTFDGQNSGELRFRVRYESGSTRAESAIATIEPAQ